MDTSSINIRAFVPEKKDHMRADNLSYSHGSFYGSGAPFQSEASKMAKLIKDPSKLIRRSIAVVMRWGTGNHVGYECGRPKTENAWVPFRARLTEMGFTWQQIDELIVHARELENAAREARYAAFAAH